MTLSRPVRTQPFGIVEGEIKLTTYETAISAGHFGPYGGRFVPEALTAALDELDAAFRSAIIDPDFIDRLTKLEVSYTGRPSPLTKADRFAEHCGEPEST